MALNLIKLCVGIESAEQLQDLMVVRKASQEASGAVYEPKHTTRMIPKRKAELLDGGSLYWVIKGQVRARQRFVDIRPFIDAEGISRCDLILSPSLIFTQWQPRRAFQGWRYLKVQDTPGDLDHGQGDGVLSPEFQQELAELGLL